MLTKTLRAISSQNTDEKDREADATMKTNGRHRWFALSICCAFEWKDSLNEWLGFVEFQGSQSRRKRQGDLRKPVEMKLSPPNGAMATVRTTCVDTSPTMPERPAM